MDRQNETKKTAADMVDFQLPFPGCKFCPNMLIDVDDVKLYGNEKIVNREIVLTCRHEKVCREAVKNMKK